MLHWKVILPECTAALLVSIPKIWKVQPDVKYYSNYYLT